MKELRPTRYPGVYKQSDGRLVARAAFRQPDGRIAQARRLLAPGTTEAEAVQVCVELKEQLRLPPAPAQTLTPLPAATDQTVEQYAQFWLRQKLQRLKPSTAEHYTMAVAERILPRIGHLPCSAVNRAVVEGWVTWAQGLTQANGKPYSQDTLRTWWRPMVTMLRDLAADHGLADPTTRVRPPEAPGVAPVREQGTLNADDLNVLLRAAEQFAPDRYAEVATLALTGMRPGELFALKWDSVDLERGQLTIRRAISNDVLVESTKTTKPRVVPIHAHLASALQAHRQRLIACNHRGLNSGMVFLNSQGGMRLPASLPALFKLIEEGAKLNQHVSPQVLRRSFNTILALAGVDRITLRAMLGHSSEQMTERYSGVPLAAKAEALHAIPISVGAQVPDAPQPLA